MANNIDPKKTPVFILAGGLGTRLSEETGLRPKPMIDIGGLPILVHIMNYYNAYGFEDFVICAGYLSWEIKEYFLNYNFRTHGLVLDTRGAKPTAEPVGPAVEKKNWRVRVLDTGHNSMTGARLARAFDAVWPGEKFENFAVTYGDGLCNVNLYEELEFHSKHGNIGTVLGVPPLARFGELQIHGTHVKGFAEKPQAASSLINGGFFLFKKDFRKFLSENESCVLERIPLETLAANEEFHVFEHRGFWYCMDTLRDKQHLQKLWEDGNAPWKIEPQVAKSKQRKTG